MGRTDRDLIDAARTGDADAFGEIVERYERAVCAVAYSGVRDRAVAEDVTQEALLVAFTKLDELRDCERLPAWLCGIARNLARARRRVMRREQSADTECATDRTPFMALDAAERDAALATALARVPDAYREPLVLFYCEQQSARDIGRALGVSDAAVHQRLSRGRALLAADTRLVEHAPPHARRSMAAAVIAALVALQRSSRVEAHPRTGGRNMFKLATIALATTLALGTTTYVVTRDRSASAQPASTTASSPISSPAAASAASPRGAAPVAKHAPTAPALPGLGQAAHAVAGSGAPVSPDCARSARHLADMSMSNQVMTDMPPERVAFADKMMVEHFEDACTTQAWSDAYMHCVLAANDPFSMRFDCAKIAPTSTALSRPDSFSLADDDRTIPATSDTSCKGVAIHIGALSMPDEKTLASFPETARKRLRDGLERGRAATVDGVEADCTQSAWSAERRACIARATNTRDLSSCP